MCICPCVCVLLTIYMPACLSVCAVSVVVAVVSRNTVHSLVSADVDKDLIIITPEQLHGSWCLPHSFSLPVPQQTNVLTDVSIVL